MKKKYVKRSNTKEGDNKYPMIKEGAEHISRSVGKREKSINGKT